ncbi:MAG: hypothetical protein IJK55_03655 [Bacteroidales bacterium]|nr:hypothetical protein [Bacteroidales bacterium]
MSIMDAARIETIFFIIKKTLVAFFRCKDTAKNELFKIGDTTATNQPTG